MSGNRDLAAVAVAALICALVALSVPLEAVRLVAAVPLCLLMPGYAITAAIFSSAPLERSKALLFSVGLSLAVLAVGALLLHLVPGGVRDASWAALLLAIVVPGCAIAARRRLEGLRSSPPRLPRPTPAQGALMLGGLLSVVAAMVLSWTPLPAKDAVGYTQLWMLPAEGRGGPGVEVGVINAEPDRFIYRLEILEDGRRPIAAPSRLILQPGGRSRGSSP